MNRISFIDEITTPSHPHFSFFVLRSWNLVLHRHPLADSDLGIPALVHPGCSLASPGKIYKPKFPCPALLQTNKIAFLKVRTRYLHFSLPPHMIPMCSQNWENTSNTSNVLWGIRFSNIYFFEFQKVTHQDVSLHVIP